jgi:hypothetical protein
MLYLARKACPSLLALPAVQRSRFSWQIGIAKTLLRGSLNAKRTMDGAGACVRYVAPDCVEDVADILVDSMAVGL